MTIIISFFIGITMSITATMIDNDKKNIILVYGLCSYVAGLIIATYLF
jgi:hypothetical protein